MWERADQQLLYGHYGMPAADVDGSKWYHYSTAETSHSHQTLSAFLGKRISVRYNGYIEESRLLRLHGPVTEFWFSNTPDTPEINSYYILLLLRLKLSGLQNMFISTQLCD
jgi:hypothetical protein